MIVEAFLRWAETAKTGDRARAANALGRAYVKARMSREERSAAEMAMTYLLDDSSPRVRLALAEAICLSADVPRNVILALAEDQTEIACHVITCSPLLTADDLVDLAIRGSAVTHMLIAARGEVLRPVSAVIAEIGDAEAALCLLENPASEISRFSLKRIAERHGDNCDIRNLLLDHENLPAEARHLLVQHVSNALSSLNLVQCTVDAQRLRRVTGEAHDAAVVRLAGVARHDEIPDLVEHLRANGKLTPSFLMHALCSGKVDFFAGAMVNLTDFAEKRVRAILAGGRMHAVAALYEQAGLPPEMSLIFVEATLLWRNASKAGSLEQRYNVSALLLQRFRNSRTSSDNVTALLDIVEKLNVAEQREMARTFASVTALAAA